MLRRLSPRAREVLLIAVTMGPVGALLAICLFFAEPLVR